MKHFNFQTIAKALLVTVVLGSPALVSAQIFPIGTVQNTNPTTVYPNPFSTDLNIQNVPHITAEVLIELYTLQGTLVFQVRVPHQPLLTIQPGSLNPATYELVVKDENYNILFSKKVIRARGSLRQ